MNNFFTDNSISWKAKGILVYLLNEANDLQNCIADLEKRSKDGRDSTRNGVKELIDSGYIAIKEIRDKGRFKSYEYIVSEQPIKK